MSEGPRSPRRVVVTGAGGFIGSHLAADQHARGHEVVAVDLDVGKLRHLESSTFRCIEGDIADPAVQERAVDGAATVFHLAAAHLSVNTPAHRYREINVDAVRTLVAACRRAGITRYVHCSSVGVFGRLETPPADEETPCRPEIPYERTKLEGEAVVLEAHRSDGFPATVVRPVWVYGPGCPRTDKLFRSIGRGRFVLGGRGNAQRHCIYIRDMVEAFHLAADSPLALGEIIIAGDDQPATVGELVGEIATLTGAPRPRSVPLALLYLAGLGAEIAGGLLRREPPLSRRTLKFFTGNTAFRTDRARRLLDFRPCYTLAAGLAETHRILTSGEFWNVPMPAARGHVRS